MRRGVRVSTVLKILMKLGLVWKLSKWVSFPILSYPLLDDLVMILMGREIIKIETPA